MFNKMRAFLIIVYLSVMLLKDSLQERNNACLSFEDYNTLETNKNCFFDPNTALRGPEVIQRYMGKVETYPLVTEDGYFIEVYRIPRRNATRKAKGVVFMMHPLMVDSKAFLTKGPDSSAFTFWRAGYDVWLGSQRGMLPVNKHVNLTTQDKAYWNFSFHEVAYYDMPVVLKMIHEKTGGSKIMFFAYSSGTTVALAYASLRPEEARKFIDIFLFVSPACYYVNTNKALRLFMSFPKTVKAVSEQMCTNMNTLANLFEFFYRLFPPLVKLSAVDFLDYITGGAPNETDPKVFNVDVSRNYRGSPFKFYWHYIQHHMLGDKFQMYDYGPVRNRAVYGKSVAPLYPIWNIDIPVFSVTGSRDALTTVEDTKRMYNALPKAAGIYGFTVTNYSHMDFSLGRNAMKVSTDILLELMDKFLEDKQKQLK